MSREAWKVSWKSGKNCSETRVCEENDVESDNSGVGWYQRRVKKGYMYSTESTVFLSSTPKGFKAARTGEVARWQMEKIKS